MLLTADAALGSSNLDHERSTNRYRLAVLSIAMALTGCGQESVTLGSSTINDEFPLISSDLQPVTGPELANLLDRKTRLDDLQKSIGRDSVVVSKMQTPSGDSQIIWQIFPKDPAWRVDVIIDSTGNPKQVYAKGELSVWHIGPIAIGRSYSELSKYNVVDISIDQRTGQVIDWHNGKLNSPKIDVRLCGSGEDLNAYRVCELGLKL